MLSKLERQRDIGNSSPLIILLGSLKAPNELEGLKFCPKHPENTESPIGPRVASEGGSLGTAHIATRFA